MANWSGIDLHFQIELVLLVWKMMGSKEVISGRMELAGIGCQPPPGILSVFVVVTGWEIFRARNLWSRPTTSKESGGDFPRIRPRILGKGQTGREAGRRREAGGGRQAEGEGERHVCPAAPPPRIFHLDWVFFFFQESHPGRIPRIVPVSRPTNQGDTRGGGVGARGWRVES